MGETTPTMSQQANRYYTPVSVEVYVNNSPSSIKWFSDLQMAYLWCMARQQTVSEDICETPYAPFPSFADEMDARWATETEQSHTSVCALCIRGSSIVEFVLTYEPER